MTNGTKKSGNNNWKVENVELERSSPRLGEVPGSDDARKDGKELRKEARNYLEKSVINPALDAFLSLNEGDRISFLQYTPPRIIQHRVIGKKSVPYVPIRYFERALNLLFNFEWGVDQMISEDMSSEMRKGSSGADLEWFDCTVTVRFWYVRGGQMRYKVVSGSWNMPRNPATSKYVVKNSAFVNATKNFARQFGIFQDVFLKEDEIENERLSIMQKDWETRDAQEKGFVRIDDIPNAEENENN